MGTADIQRVQVKGDIYDPKAGIKIRIPPPLKPFPLMPNQPAPETELLRAAYAGFNARDIDAALALMTPEVEWPRAGR
jgi:hypothetical protein